MITKKIITAIPIAYKDEGNIKELYKRLSATLKKITPNYEIIYVNDSSPDSSQEILSKLASKDKHLTVVRHSRNFGAQNAFTVGMKLAIGNAVVIMDGDLQDPPEMIEKFVKKWLEGFDVVYGIRRKREKSMGSLWETLYHWFYIIFNKLSEVKTPVDVGDFSLMDRKVVDQINNLPEKDRFIRGLRAWVGYKQTGIDYIRPERFSGKSTNSFIRNINWARKAIFSFSYTPLEWVFYTAIFSIIISLLVTIFYIILFFVKPDLPRGFLTILVAVVYLGSIQLVVLSILSEYIKRIFIEVKARPSSVIGEIINDHRKPKKYKTKNIRPIVI